jgi:hypothetical protein
MARCISMPMKLNETTHIYTAAAELHWWVFMLDVLICIWVLMGKTEKAYVYFYSASLHKCFKGTKLVCT